MVADPIADLITRIKNAGDASQVSLSLPFSKLKHEVAELLKRQGFLAEVAKYGKKAKKTLDISLKYTADGRPEVTGVSRISRLSKRVYMKASEIRPVKYGQGILVLSTPKGLKTGEEARKEHVGGEALFKIW